MNNSKNTLKSQYPQARAVFSGSSEPYLTNTNKSTSNLQTTPVFDKQYIRELSAKLRSEFENSNALRFNDQIRRGWVKIKRVNSREFAVYHVPNRLGNTSTLRNKGNFSFSDTAVFAAKRRMIETIKANEDFCYFFTGTFDPKRWNSQNFDTLYRSLTRWLRGRGIKYILIPELHKDGKKVHFHGVFNATIEPYLAEFNLKHKLPMFIRNGLRDGRLLFNCPDYAKTYGYVSIEKIKNLDAVANYVSKYITKSFENKKCRLSYRRYFCSLGLKHPEFVQYQQVSYSNCECSLSEYLPKVVYKRLAETGDAFSLVRGSALPSDLPPKSWSAKPTIRD